MSNDRKFSPEIATVTVGLAVAGGMRTMLQDGASKCVAGLTDLRQVLAVCSL